MSTNDLTEKMKETLVQIGYGVCSNGNRFVLEDDREIFVDGRSAQALISRGLVGWRGVKGIMYGTISSELDLTDAGWKKFYELQERN